MFFMELASSWNNWGGVVGLKQQVKAEEFFKEKNLVILRRKSIFEDAKVVNVSFPLAFLPSCSYAEIRSRSELRSDW